MENAPENTIGLTKIGGWEDMSSHQPLTDQLDAAAIAYTRSEIPTIVGMGGPAYTVFYASPKTGNAVTVLCVPVRYEVDGFAEDYYYFEGMAPEAVGADGWTNTYDECRRLGRVR